MPPPWLGELHTLKKFRSRSEPYLILALYMQNPIGFRRAGPRNGHNPRDRHRFRQTDRSGAEEGEMFGLQEPHQPKFLW